MVRFGNDEGVAYVWFMIVALLICGSLAWMTLSAGFNQMLVPINDRVTSGEMSTQTHGALSFNLTIFSAVPIFLIIGSLIYAIMAGVNKRNLGG